jgi:hypothetical protein
MRHLIEARKIPDDTKADFEPEQDENAECEIFVGATIGDQFNGTVCTLTKQATCQ